MKKEEIINEIVRQLDDRISFLKQSIQAAKESRDNETKSSVGDKYETGRAMVQMELEKNRAQLAKTEHLKTSLNKIDLHKRYEKVEFGSFVETNLGNYFISVAFGKVEINNVPIFSISLNSPVGKTIEAKTTGEKINFQGRQIEIKSIS
ncbi:hypothetical protein GM418_01575 [Maribellus comscasis]|uniref:3-oxoacyl-ACP synthase n=1 Tax=Maribellus comscasis TaxID=2681766 RepID=A0A6I6JMU8_9BACT|nr:hypothetical protein [Maribellus comscasis]QGY42388.1 hypothetical protein GM418_01575 [Maribellus comscasis]